MLALPKPRPPQFFLAFIVQDMIMVSSFTGLSCTENYYHTIHEPTFECWNGEN